MDGYARNLRLFAFHNNSEQSQSLLMLAGLASSMTAARKMACSAERNFHGRTRRGYGY